MMMDQSLISNPIKPTTMSPPEMESHIESLVAEEESNLAEASSLKADILVEVVSSKDRGSKIHILDDGVPQVIPMTYSNVTDNEDEIVMMEQQPLMPNPIMMFPQAKEPSVVVEEEAYLAEETSSEADISVEGIPEEDEVKDEIKNPQGSQDGRTDGAQNGTNNDNHIIF